MISEKICSTCGIKKSESEYYKKKNNRYAAQCKQCTISRIKNNQIGISSIQGYKNKQCTTYLGVHVAEHLLSKVFSNVMRMPSGHKGYDFICGKGFKIDVKSSSLILATNSDTHHWFFTTKKNKVADYFALLAFDNRVSLTPLHFWIIPTDILNDKVTATISPTTTHKWKEFEKPTDKIITYCNDIKTKSNRLKWNVLSD